MSTLEKELQNRGYQIIETDTQFVGGQGMIRKLKKIDDNSKKFYAMKLHYRKGKYMQNEVQLLAKFRGNDKNLCSSIEHISLNGLIIIIMDFYPTNLGELFRIYDRPLDENSALDVIKSLLISIDYLHDQGACHRDLKLENILIDCDEQDWQNFKNEGNPNFKNFNQFFYNPRTRLILADFGVAQIEQTMHHTDIFTNYQAPEVEDGFYDGEKADIYSLGAIWSDLLNKKNNTNISTFNKIMIEKLCSPHPKQRISRGALKYFFGIQTISPKSIQIERNQSVYDSTQSTKDDQKEFQEPPQERKLSKGQIRLINSVQLPDAPSGEAVLELINYVANDAEYSQLIHTLHFQCLLKYVLTGSFQQIDQQQIENLKELCIPATQYAFGNNIGAAYEKIKQLCQRP